MQCFLVPQCLTEFSNIIIGPVYTICFLNPPFFLTTSLSSTTVPSNTMRMSGTCFRKHTILSYLISGNSHLWVIHLVTSFILTATSASWGVTMYPWLKSQRQPIRKTGSNPCCSWHKVDKTWKVREGASTTHTHTHTHVVNNFFLWNNCLIGSQFVINL